MQDDFKDIFTVEDVSCAVEYASGSNVLYFKDRQLNHEYENIHLAFLHDVSIIINHLCGATAPSLAFDEIWNWCAETNAGQM